VIASESHLRQEIVLTGQLMYQKGYISGSEGNLSARLSPGRLLITPAGLHKGRLQPDDLLLVDESGQRAGPSTAANRKLSPTSELPMHLEAYRLRPEVNAVIHAHPATCIALSIAGISLADCLLPETIVLLGLVPTTAYATPSSEENALAVRRFIATHDALVLQRHGTLTVGKELAQAFIRLELVEQNARIGFMLAQLGARRPLPAEEVSKLLAMRQAMGLSRPSESQEFCQVCGVCHSGEEHLPTLWPSAAPRPAGATAAGPQALPPIGRQPLDDQRLRLLVADVVERMLGPA
jgi:L-fuculose-phosphate aldolase